MEKPPGPCPRDDARLDRHLAECTRQAAGWNETLLDEELIDKDADDYLAQVRHDMTVPLL